MINRVQGTAYSLNAHQSKQSVKGFNLLSSSCLTGEGLVIPERFYRGSRDSRLRQAGMTDVGFGNDRKTGDKGREMIDERRNNKQGAIVRRLSSIVFLPTSLIFSVRSTLYAMIFLPVLLFAAGEACAVVKLKIAVVNPSSTEKQVSPVRYDLPKGIGPGQIVDLGDLEMKYDFDKGLYYLEGSMELDPSEQRVVEVTLRDVWAIPKTDLMRLKDHTVLMTGKLQGTKHFDAGKAISGNIHTQLDGLIRKEENTALPIKDRINQYYEDLVALNEVKENIGMLENLVLDTGGIVEERVQVPTTLAVPIDSAKKGEGAPVANVIDLKVKVTNPSKTEKMNKPVKFLLPAEVSPKYVLDPGGLEVTYDFDKECFSLYKQEVELAPGEVREFVVKIQDMWRIAQVEVDALKSHTHNIMVLLEGSEHYSRAKLSADKINTNMDLILKSQDAKVSAMEHIAYYRENMKLLRSAKEEIAELERLVSQRGTSAGVTVKWPEEAGGGSLAQRKRGFEGIDMIAKSIFKGKAPTIATTWKIIYLILAFLGIVAAFFFSLWYIQLKKKSEK